ncbi:MAG: hypothetical protein AAF191_11445 [Verrucomicrobiota bacterium]
MAKHSPLPRLLLSLLRNRNPWVKGSAIAGLLVLALMGYQVTSGPSPQGASPNSPLTPISSNSDQGYDRLESVRVVDHRNNDGDSFLVSHEGKTFELRLYFVDTPEKYLSDRHEDQRRRVADQAQDMDLTVDLTVKLGQAAKKVVGQLVAKQPFTVYTKWERVYDGDRYYGFVELPLPDAQNPSYLTELLIQKGLGRIHTKGAPTPDGRSSRQYEDYLRSLEKKAKTAGAGAWAL